MQRVDTPGCAEAIHLNSAGAALPPKPIGSAVLDGGLTAVLLLGGAALYAAGSIRARRQAALAL